MRFDPDNLQDGAHVYSVENAYLGHADCHAPEGFLSLEAARTHAKAKRAFRKSVKDMADAEIVLDVTTAGRMLDDLPKPEAANVSEAAVLRPAFPAQPFAPPPEPRVLSADEKAAQEAIVAEFKRPEPAAPTAQDEGLERFRDALDIEARMEAQQPVSPEEFSS